MQKMGAADLTSNRVDGLPENGKANVDTANPPASTTQPRRAELDKSLFHGIAWSGGVKYLTQFLSWASTLIVARLLTPSDYGLVAMATVYLGFITLVSEFGVGAAVVTLRDLSEEQLQQLNAFSVLLGGVGFLVSLLAAYPLAWFFHSPSLPPVVMVMSIAFVITSFKVVPASLLERELRFKTLSLVEGVRAAVLAVASVLFAMAGFRYWTLVLGGILSATISTALILRDTRKGFRFPQFRSLGKALTFSRHILGARLSWYIYSNADFAVAGRTLGEIPLGNYTLAWNLANIPLQSLSSLVSSITPGFFSVVQKNKAELRRYLLNLTEGLSLVTFPLTTGLALVARDFVLVFLGPKWLPIVAPLQLLALYASVRAITPLLTPILNVTGEARFNMRLGLVTIVLFPLAFVVGSRWGTVGIAVAWMIVHPLIMVPVFRRTFSKIDLSAREYVGAVRPAITGIAAMSAAVLLVKMGVGAYRLPVIVALAAQVLVGALAYTGSVFLVHRSRVNAIYRRFKTAREA